MIFCFNFTFSAKLPTTLPGIIFNIHSSKNPLNNGSVFEHNSNNVTNRNMLRNRDHVIYISSAFSPACHFYFSNN